MKTTVRLVCLAIFVTVSTASTKHLYEPRIINGHDATEGQFPHMASLQNRFTHQHYCGAAILSSRFLLTAAHCCHGDQGNPKMVIAIVGALRLSSGGVKVELDTITPHGGFSFHTARNDIGVIRTVKEIEFTDLVQPIALSTVDLPDDRTTQVILSGWGRFERTSNVPPDVLQFGEFTAISIGECEKRFTNVPRLRRMVYKANVCTVNNKNSGACFGDSGGALINATDPNNKVVVGITSWVYPCALGYPDVYSRVYSHLDWIHTHIEYNSSIDWKSKNSIKSFTVSLFVLFYHKYFIN